jgi:flagellar biosynthesis GTPase FlhF
LLVVKGLENFKEATNYRSVFEKDQTINVPRQVHYVIISVDNFNLLINEGRTFEDYFNYLQEKNDKEHSDLEKKELDEAEKKAQEEAEAQAAIEREKARIEAEQMEREAAELAKRDAEEKAREEAEEKARLEAEAAEQARLEAEEKAREEAERKQIQASDYRSRSTVNTTQQPLTDKERKAIAKLCKTDFPNATKLVGGCVLFLKEHNDELATSVGAQWSHNFYDILAAMTKDAQIASVKDCVIGAVKAHEPWALNLSKHEHRLKELYKAALVVRDL